MMSRQTPSHAAIFIRFGAAALLGSSLLASGASAESYKLGVDGLACPLCTFGIEKQLKKLPGVAAVTTDLDSSTVTVTTPPGTKIARPQIDKAVKKAGFKIRSFEEAGISPS